MVLNDPARDHRAVTVDLWHPAPPEARQAPRSAYTFLPGVAYDSVLAAADVEAATDGPFPLVVYSHGSGGMRFVAAHLAELLASHGFVVAAPDHAGNTVFDVVFGTEAPRERNEVERPADVAFVITAVLDGALAPGVVDPERVGVVGHSFGGFTALASVAGHRDVPADPRVRAVAAHAPWTWLAREPGVTPGPLLADEALARVAVPTLLISGTVDRTTPPKANTDRPWRLIPGRPAYRVDIVDAGHQAFTDVGLHQRMLAGRPDIPADVVALIDDFAATATAPDLIDLDLAHQIIDGCTVAFLRRHLAADGSDGSDDCDVGRAAAAGGDAVRFEHRS